MGNCLMRLSDFHSEYYDSFETKVWRKRCDDIHESNYDIRKKISYMTALQDERKWHEYCMPKNNYLMLKSILKRTISILLTNKVPLNEKLEYLMPEFFYGVGSLSFEGDDWSSSFIDFSQTNDYIEGVQLVESNLIERASHSKELQELLSRREIEGFMEFGPGNSKFIKYMSQLHNIKEKKYYNIDISFGQRIQSILECQSMGMDCVVYQNIPNQYSKRYLGHTLTIPLPDDSIPSYNFRLGENIGLKYDIAKNYNNKNILYCSFGGTLCNNDFDSILRKFNPNPAGSSCGLFTLFSDDGLDGLEKEKYISKTLKMYGKKDSEEGGESYESAKKITFGIASAAGIDLSKVEYDVVRSTADNYRVAISGVRVKEGNTLPHVCIAEPLEANSFIPLMYSKRYSNKERALKFLENGWRERWSVSDGGMVLVFAEYTGGPLTERIIDSNKEWASIILNEKNKKNKIIY